MTASLRGRTSTGASFGRTRGSIAAAGEEKVDAGGGLLAKIGAGCGPDCKNSALITIAPVASNVAAVSVGRRLTHFRIATVTPRRALSSSSSMLCRAARTMRSRTAFD